MSFSWRHIEITKIFFSILGWICILINIYFSFFRAKLLQKEIKQSSGCCGGSNTNRQVREVESIYVFVKIGKLILSSIYRAFMFRFTFQWNNEEENDINDIVKNWHRFLMKYLADRREFLKCLTSKQCFQSQFSFRVVEAKRKSKNFTIRASICHMMTNISIPACTCT